ncbi:MAG: response regulator, partial [Candidatus Dadabacteria bacterium]
EDSATVRQFTIEALKKGGFVNLQVFTNGKEGYEFVKNNPESVDIIISDIEMPEMDGLTFCKKVKESKELKKIPFLFFSSLVNDMMRKKCDSVGGEAAYSKPEVDQLVKDLQSFLGS